MAIPRSVARKAFSHSPGSFSSFACHMVIHVLQWRVGCFKPSPVNLGNFCLSVAIKLVFLLPEGTLLPDGTPLDGIPTPVGTPPLDGIPTPDGTLSSNGTLSPDGTPPPNWNFPLVEECDS